MMGKMPPMVLQRYNARQTVCFCGVFPEIRRAWASVDNSLFLWRYDKWYAAALNVLARNEVGNQKAAGLTSLVYGRQERCAVRVQQRGAGHLGRGSCQA